MRTIDVHAFEDRSRPAGGHAVICLVGIGSIDRNAAFVLKPLDATLDEREQQHWPNGEHAPLETRTGEAGVELIVGPAIVENPLLVPGTPVHISLPHEGISGEFLWPSITQPSRPRRRSLQTLHREPGDAAPPAPRPAALQPKTLPAEVAARTPVEPAMSGSPRPDGAKPNGAVHEVTFDGPGETWPVRGSTADDDRLNTAVRGSASAAVDASAQRGRAKSLSLSPAGAAALAIAALLAIQGTTYAIMSMSRAVATAPAATAPSPTRAGADASIYAILAVADTSPAGVPAVGVPPARILELANASLFAEDAARNTEEAAFWLKRYFVTQSGDDRVRRALTQLGSTYAAPSRGQPDYAAARHIWEIAAAKGDPVAMCFIAKLHTDGLGGPTDRNAAAHWTEKARALGGCGDR